MSLCGCQVDLLLWVSMADAGSTCSVWLGVWDGLAHTGGCWLGRWGDEGLCYSSSSGFALAWQLNGCQVAGAEDTVS